MLSMAAWGSSGVSQVVLGLVFGLNPYWESLMRSSVPAACSRRKTRLAKTL